MAEALKNVLKASKINVDDIIPGEIFTYKQGARKVPLMMKDPSAPKGYRPFSIQTGFIRTYGLKEHIDEETKKVKFGLTLAFEKDCPGEDHDALKAMGERIKQLGYENRKEWLKKPAANKDTMDAFFNEVIKVSKDEMGVEDGKYPPCIRPKIPYYNNEFCFQLYDKSEKDGKGLPVLVSKELYPDFLVKNAKVKCIMVPSIWLMTSSYGVTLELRKCIVDKPEEVGFNFIDDESEEEKGEESETVMETEESAEVEVEEEPEAMEQEEASSKKKKGSKKK